MPKFQNMDVWRQAEELMQPAFIRLVANIGKHLDESSWKGQYEDILVWGEGVDDETKQQVMQLRHDLETLSADPSVNSASRIAEIEKTLATMPSPYPGYQLCLSQGTNQIRVDLWEICYRICFRDYDPETGTSWQKGFGQPASQGVEVDSSLFDETGEVDWDRLDAKTCKLVEQIFATLPL